MHHAPGKAWWRKVCIGLEHEIPDNTFMNTEMPTFPWKRSRHAKGCGEEVDGVYQPTFHDLFEGNAEKNILPLVRVDWGSRDSIRQNALEAVKQTCEALQMRYPNDGVDYSEIGKLVRAWMKAQLPELIDPL